MNEQEKINELMKPRYKCIADYPGNNIDIGTIITLSVGDDQRFYTGGVCEPYAYTANGAMSEDDFRRYEYLYKKLEWWQEREPEEMPEYVKNKHEVVKIEHHFSMYSLNISNEPLGVHTHFTYADKNTSNYTFWLPATAADYQAFIAKPLNQD